MIYTAKSRPSTPKRQRYLLPNFLPCFCSSWGPSLSSSMIVTVFLFSSFRAVYLNIYICWSGPVTLTCFDYKICIFCLDWKKKSGGKSWKRLSCNLNIIMCIYTNTYREREGGRTLSHCINVLRGIQDIMGLNCPSLNK